MSARFIVSRKCETKEELTLTGLLDLQRQQGLLALFEEAAAAGELAEVDLDEPLELVFPGAPDVVSVTMRELREQTERLKQYRKPCRVCPVNVTGRVGGCVTYLPYPLSEGMEYLFWLAARQGIAGKLPQDRLPFVRLFVERAMARLETPWTDSMRRSGHLMGPQPLLASWGPIWRRRSVSSAQLLEEFFRTPQLFGEELLVHTGFLGAVVLLGQSLTRALRDDEERLVALREDLAPYEILLRFMQRASAQEQGVQVWP